MGIPHESGIRAVGIRIIGNAASHPGELTRDNLFDAYDILEVVLEDMYIGRQKNIREMVDRTVSLNRP
jgi:hypothetical protein